jgi:hypothetical protein
LKLRTDFLRRFYKQASFPFLEAKRKIREHEEPFNDPPFDDSGDPPYLKEWEEADEAVEVLGQACVSFLSGSLKLFLNESEQEFRKFYGPLPEKDASTFKKHGFVTGYQHWFASMGINMEDSRVDISVVSEIVYTRNMAEHHNSIGSMQLSQDESAQKKFPRPFFANPIEDGIFAQQLEEDPDAAMFGGLLSVQPEKLHAAIDAVEKLCDWLEPQWRIGPKKLPPEPQEQRSWKGD